MGACILIPVWLPGQIHAGECCYENVGSCEVQKVARCDFLLRCNLIKTCMCVPVCVSVSLCSSTLHHVTEMPSALKCSQYRRDA